MAFIFTGSAAAEKPGIRPDAPPKSCKSKWCEKVRTTLLIADRIDDVLAGKGSPMFGHGVEITRAGRVTNTNPFLLLGIAGLESAYGRLMCGPPLNAWGIGACGYWDTTGCVGGGSYSRWVLAGSWQRAFTGAARFLECRWPGHRSVYSLRGYCACGGWAERVAWQMRSFGSGPGSRWKHAVAALP
ncbi:MAG: hypothetical protein IT304_04750 [Dehalococcoidia bacterium]|nr:hypothetical protein [Dehalococcoidia bacterium]